MTVGTSAVGVDDRGMIHPTFVRKYNFYGLMTRVITATITVLVETKQPVVRKRISE